MNKIPKEERLRNIVCRGLEHLSEQLEYSQSDVLNKLKTLQYAVSPASLSNIKNGKAVGLSSLSTVARGIEMLLRQELDMAFDVETQDFRAQNTAGWNAVVVPEKPAGSAGSPTYKFHMEGRVSLQEKTDFIQNATQEIIEVGVRLHSFVSYFISQKESAYKTHILTLLGKGVHIKGYLLDPDSNEARIYFEDRARVQAHEKDSLGEIKKVIERLRSICEEFDALQLPGKLNIYLYKHIPYGLFFAVDGATNAGRMMVSPYLYGVRRAHCPVLELTKSDQPVLFRKYWESMQLFMDGAKPLV